MASTPNRTWHSASAGCPSSTCRWPGTSRCGRRTGATGFCSTARSTTTSSWAPNCGSRASRCGPPVTPRCCWRPTPGWARTSCTGSAACTRSLSGTPGPASCSAPGTRSASSRSTTASTAGSARSPPGRPVSRPASRAALPRRPPLPGRPPVSRRLPVPRRLPPPRPTRAAAVMRRRSQPATRTGGSRPAATAARTTLEAPGTVDLRLRFSSERKALAEPGELTALDADALQRYLAFQYVPAPDTMTPPIRVLPPGHAMIARPGRPVDVYRYWRADLRPARAGSESTPGAILAAMRDSVAVHLRSHAPLGAFLSGGIDSAAICALAAEHRPDLLTFTVGFEREGYSEIDRAQETAAAIGVRSIPYVISREEFFHHLPQVIWHLDDPMADAAAVPLWFVAREASKHVKVVLSGEGSDELFGGYAIYHQPGVVRAGERLPDWGRAPIKKVAAIIPSGVKGRGFLERTSTPLRRRYIGNARVFTDGEIDKVVGPGAATPWDVTDPIYDQAEQAELDDTSTMQLVDINTWLAGDILVKADRMTMAHSLELRVPFLDREVLGVAARLARTEKIGAGTTKLALRTAMSEVLPKAAAERAKLGFPVPIGHWLTGQAYGFAEQLLREAQTDEWINRQEALSLLERLRAGEPGVEWRHLWVLIVFSLWHRIFVERAYDPVALGWGRTARVSR